MMVNKGIGIRPVRLVLRGASMPERRRRFVPHDVAARVGRRRARRLPLMLARHVAMLRAGLS